VRILNCVLSLAAAVACSNSPTAPSRAPAVAGQLRWDVVSTTCAPVDTPSPQPDMGSATIVTDADGSLSASWPYVVAGRSVMLYARFVRENGTWAMCSWDTADVLRTGG
jgi:hypothetical protein